MATAMLTIAILCLAGLCWLVWDGRERRQPKPRPKVTAPKRWPHA